MTFASFFKGVQASAVAAVVVAASASANAVIIDFNTPIPDANVLINFNNSGLDWVYAGPIAPNEFGLGNIEVPSYRSSEGWRYATTQEWANRPDWLDFALPGFSAGAQNSFSDHSTYRFASEYWGDFDHIDLGDAEAGYVTNGDPVNTIGSLTDVYETWFVRDTRGGHVPDAGSSLVLTLLAAGALGAWRRRVD